MAHVASEGASWSSSNVDRDLVAFFGLVRRVRVRRAMAFKLQLRGKRSMLKSIRKQLFT